jgi:hypothetical protein
VQRYSVKNFQGGGEIGLIRGSRKKSIRKAIINRIIRRNVELKEAEKNCLGFSEAFATNLFTIRKQCHYY